MTPEQAAHESRNAIVHTTSGFMFDAGFYAHGASLGFDEIDIYFAGRGGLLGDVPADVVAAALVFFAPDKVAAAWERSSGVMSRREAALELAGQCHRWAIEHLGGDVDWNRCSELLGRIVASASVAGAPLFAGWRLLPEPDDPRALTLHRMNALRELRGGLHGAAVLTVGLTPLEAISVASPQLVGIFGYDEAIADTAPLAERWKLAEARTDRMAGRSYAVLDADERQELVDLLGAITT
jgi:hypothetical protein